MDIVGIDALQQRFCLAYGKSRHDTEQRVNVVTWNLNAVLPAREAHMQSNQQMTQRLNLAMALLSFGFIAAVVFGMI